MYCEVVTLNISDVAVPGALDVFPMHGLTKMLSEGFRTRDAHLIEWFSKLGRQVSVYSRPDPWPVKSMERMRRTESIPEGVGDKGRQVLTMPPLRDRKQWWILSTKYFRYESTSPIVTWNPFMFRSAGVMMSVKKSPRHIHLDLLDDWSVHHGYSSIRSEVEKAYQQAFETAQTVSANSEGTVALAQRYGRSDVKLLPNGVDPQRFSTISRASGRPKIGYFGKIGRRLDTRLIRSTAIALPDYDFLFAGPVLDSETKDELVDLANIVFLGDIPYRDAARTLASFDLGWVPHGVVSGQVGGDAIKIYEYRAAGLPVVTTPIIGVKERPLDGVNVADADDHPMVIRSYFQQDNRAERIPSQIPNENTWQYKAEMILASISDTSTLKRDDTKG